MAVSTNIQWLIPKAFDPAKNPTGLVSNVLYSISIFVSTNGENGAYSVINTISAGPSNSTSTYTDNNGDPAFFYYVTYNASGGPNGPPVLARIAPIITVVRLTNKVYSVLPEVIQVRMDANLTQIQDALQNALNMVNAAAPVTAYVFNNMPPYHSTAVEFGAQWLLYMEQYLQISIRDFSYGVSGISMNIDRGARINSIITTLTAYWNNYIKTVKYYDYPNAIGLGSLGIATPQARIFGILFDHNI